MTDYQTKEELIETIKDAEKLIIEQREYIEMLKEYIGLLKQQQALIILN